VVIHNHGKWCPNRHSKAGCIDVIPELVRIFDRDLHTMPHRRIGANKKKE
jgi:hypothetical protein